MCNVCKETRKMILVWGNQSYEYSLIPCTCQGGPSFVGNHKDGFQIKSELEEYKKWLSSDSEEFMREPDKWFPNTEGYLDPSEIEEDEEDFNETLSLSIKKIIDNDDAEIVIKEVKELPELQNTQLAFEMSNVHKGHNCLLEYNYFNDLFTKRERVSIYHKAGTKDKDILALCKKYL